MSENSYSSPASDAASEPVQNVDPADESGLPESAQRVNSWVFIINVSLSYLAGPVFYIGILHAGITKEFGASAPVANLPEAVYMWMFPASVIIAWLFPSPWSFCSRRVAARPNRPRRRRSLHSGFPSAQVPCRRRVSRDRRSSRHPAGA